MPRYDVGCPNCGVQETFLSSREAMEKGGLLECPVCGRIRYRVIYAPQFTEDRTRMFRGPLGNGYSFALGAPMPDSRAARDRLAKEKGVEFISKSEHLAENKEAAEAVAYREHVDEGGKHYLKPPPPPPGVFVEKPTWAQPLLEKS